MADGEGEGEELLSRVRAAVGPVPEDLVRAVAAWPAPLPPTTDDACAPPEPARPAAVTQRPATDR